MSLSTSQKQYLMQAQQTLRERGMVYLSGRMQGKTRIITRVEEMVPEKHGIGTTLRFRTERDSDLVFISKAFFGRADKITINHYMRLILEMRGIKPGRSQWQVVQQFEQMLEDLYNRGQVLVISVDNGELLPEKAFLVLKALNEWRTDRKDIGIAVLVAGEYGKMRMPESFLKRTTEIRVGRISALEEIAQMIETHWPGEAKWMMPDALHHICHAGETTLDLRRAAGKVITQRRKLRLDRVTAEVVSHALAA